MKRLCYNFFVKSTCIPYPNILNCRNLSSMVNKDGFHIRENALIRSAYLINATNKELQNLRDSHHITKVFGLRSFAEKQEKPEHLIECMEYCNQCVQNERIIGADQNEDTVAKRKATFDKLKKRIENDMEAGMENMRFFYHTLGKEEYSQQCYGSFLKEVYTTVEAQHGSMKEFLKHLGIDEKVKEAYKKKYLIREDN